MRLTSINVLAGVLPGHVSGTAGLSAALLVGCTWGVMPTRPTCRRSPSPGSTTAGPPGWCRAGQPGMSRPRLPGSLSPLVQAATARLPVMLPTSGSFPRRAYASPAATGHRDRQYLQAARNADSARSCIGPILCVTARRLGRFCAGRCDLVLAIVGRGLRHVRSYRGYPGCRRPARASRRAGQPARARAGRARDGQRPASRDRRARALSLVYCWPRAPSPPAIPAPSGVCWITADGRPAAAAPARQGQTRQYRLFR